MCNVGDQLPPRVFGPHTVASFATEWRSYLFSIWGTLDRREINLEDFGFSPEFAGHENDPIMERINPELTDGAYYGASRGHLFPAWARKIGMPRAYGYGASMGAWITDYFAGWAGEWGMVVHTAANYRGPALSGDITDDDRHRAGQGSRRGGPPHRPGRLPHGESEGRSSGHGQGGNPVACQMNRYFATETKLPLRRRAPIDPPCEAIISSFRTVAEWQRG